MTEGLFKFAICLTLPWHPLYPEAYLLPSDVIVVPEYAVTQEAWRSLRTALFGACWPGPMLFDVDWVRQQVGGGQQGCVVRRPLLKVHWVRYLICSIIENAVGSP